MQLASRGIGLASRCNIISGPKSFGEQFNLTLDKWITTKVVVMESGCVCGYYGPWYNLCTQAAGSIGVGDDGNLSSAFTALLHGLPFSPNPSYTNSVNGGMIPLR
jgi:hypothetical protein